MRRLALAQVLLTLAQHWSLHTKAFAIHSRVGSSWLTCSRPTRRSAWLASSVAVFGGRAVCLRHFLYPFAPPNFCEATKAFFWESANPRNPLSRSILIPASFLARFRPTHGVKTEHNTGRTCFQTKRWKQCASIEPHAHVPEQNTRWGEVGTPIFTVSV